jgi:SAM-dependent methyltransferase
VDIGAFYDVHSYPPPVDDLDAYQRIWDDRRRRVESCLLWPGERYRDDRAILVAGCGTVQAAHYALRWPRSRVVGIDISVNSLAFADALKRRHALGNLELRELPVERAAELGVSFDHIACTGVLHHLDDPDAGLRALRSALAPSGSINLMVYAPYGRAGIYMLQEYCRRLRIGWSREEIADLAATLRALPRDHPLAGLVRNSPDFTTEAGLADALLHPQDRAYSVPEFLRFLERCGLVFGRWVRQAPYLPTCGAIASTPHASKLAALPRSEQYAAIELFRGTMVRHSAVVFAREPRRIDFDAEAWPDYVPLRLPDAVTVLEQLPDGAAAVLINRNHTFTDLYLPIDAVRAGLLAMVDGRRTIREIARAEREASPARDYFRKLWEWDQVLFEIPGGNRPIL